MTQELEKKLADILADKLVLVVEDTSSSRMLVAGLVRGLGAHRVVAAVDGADALTKTVSRDLVPDLVLCDWVMPNMDGLELLTRLKGGHPAVKFIMMTVKTEAEAVILARKHGVDGYVAKPFTRDSLCRLARRWYSRLRPIGRLRWTGATAQPADLDADSAIHRRWAADIRQRAGELSAALTGADRDSARRAVHSLKGAALNLGHARLGLLCVDLDRLALAGDLAGIAALRRELVAACDGSLAALGHAGLAFAKDSSIVRR